MNELNKKEQAKAIYEFLQNTHDLKNGNVLIRLLKNKTDFEKTTKTIIINDNEESSINAILKRLEDFKNYNTYYSRYTLKKGAKSTIKQNLVNTKILIADFDKIDKFELENNVLYLLDFIGLNPSYIIESGNGFHIIYILDEASEDPNINKAFNELLHIKGFNNDMACNGPIMRLPYSYNIKDINNIKETKIYYYSDDTYSIQEIFEKLEELQSERDISGSKKKGSKSINELDNKNIVKLDKIIDNILNSAPKKETAERTIKFLATYFLKSGLSKKETESIIIEWALKNDLKYSYKGYESYVLKYINDIASRLKECDLLMFHNAEYGYIQFENSLIDIQTPIELYKQSSQAFILWLRMAIEEDSKQYTIEELSKLLNKSLPTTQRIKSELEKTKLLNKVKIIDNINGGASYVYEVNKEEAKTYLVAREHIKELLNYYDIKKHNDNAKNKMRLEARNEYKEENSLNVAYTQIDKYHEEMARNKIIKAIDETTIKYILLLYSLGKTEIEVYQETLIKLMGMSENTRNIYKLQENAVELGFIEVKKVYDPNAENGKLRNKYILLKRLAQ